MNKKLLHKGLIIGVPIAIIITIILSIVILNNGKANAKTSLKDNVAGPNEMEMEPLVVMDESKPGYLSTNKYLKDFLDIRNKKKIDNTIIYYANQFNLDSSKVLEIARKLTNNYESESFKKYNTIKDGDGHFSTIEAGIVYFVRYLYRNPEKYGTNGNEIGDKGVVRRTTKKENGHYILDNGLTYEQFLAKICEMFGINKTLALAIVYEESGKMNSTLFTQSNNMGGLRGGTGWLSFPSLEAGTICYVFTLKNLLDRSNLDSNQTSSVYALSGIYVHGNASDPAPEWTGKVLNYMNIINSSKAFG